MMVVLPEPIEPVMTRTLTAPLSMRILPHSTRRAVESVLSGALRVRHRVTEPRCRNGDQIEMVARGIESRDRLQSRTGLHMTDGVPSATKAEKKIRGRRDAQSERADR